ncbi:MAG: ABC transporter ATP-binding protein [Spirochaetales bacterium]|nr:ABC transporter ATP-binding protein [Spirochaetales bacterium]
MKSGIALLIRTLRFLLTKNPWSLFAIFILTAAEGALPAVLILIMKAIIDSIAHGGMAGLPVLVALWCAAMAGQFGISFVLRRILDGFILAASHSTSTLVIRKGLSLKGLRCFESEAFHSIYSRLANTDYRVENFVNNFRYLFKNLVQFLSVFAIFWPLGAWIPLAIAVSAVPGVIASTRNARLAMEHEDSIDGTQRRAAYFRNAVVSPATVKENQIFGFGALLSNRYLTAQTELKRRALAYSSKKAWNEFIGTLFRIVAVGFIMVGLADRVAKGLISVGQLALFLQSIFHFSTAMLELVEFWSFQAPALQYFAKLFDFLATKDTLVLPINAIVLDGEIERVEFKNVSFAYEPGRAALCGVSFTIERGQAIALVGENGAGKTTIVKLIARLYDPDSGEILVNGIDLRNIDVDLWRARISAVFQDFARYHLSVAENVSPDGTASSGEFWNKGFLDLGFIDELPGRGEATLGKEFGGTELSGGQWQKLAIARGLVKPHEILLVDEPTASIDPIQEADVYRALFEKKAALSLLVTHRLGSVKNADHILVLKDGRVVEQGAHDELVAAGGCYKTLYDSQAGLYKQ